MVAEVVKTDEPRAALPVPRVRALPAPLQQAQAWPNRAQPGQLVPAVLPAVVVPTRLKPTLALALNTAAEPGAQVLAVAVAAEPELAERPRDALQLWVARVWAPDADAAASEWHQPPKRARLLLAGWPAMQQLPQQLPEQLPELPSAQRAAKKIAAQVLPEQNPRVQAQPHRTYQRHRAPRLERLRPRVCGEPTAQARAPPRSLRAGPGSNADDVLRAVPQGLPTVHASLSPSARALATPDRPSAG